MPRDYTRSPEGLAEYKKLGIPYDDSMDDGWWDEYERKTKKTDPKDRRIEIQNLVRLLLPPDDIENREDPNKWRQVIYHDESHIRKDMLGNTLRKYRPNIGIYPKPIPRYVVKVIPEEGYDKATVVEGIETIEKCYSLEFNNKKNIDDVRKKCTPNTSFLIKQGEGGTTIKVDTWKDWSEGQAQDLLILGRIPRGPEERQYIADTVSGKIRLQYPVHTPAYR
jgi:hypothetical protein